MCDFGKKLEEIINERPMSALDITIENIKEYGDSVVIFGAKRFGERILDILKECDIDVSCFCDNYYREKTFCGLPCIPFEVLKRDYKNSFIIVASDNYYKEIKTQLIENGFMNKHISPFLYFFNVTVKQMLESRVDWEHTYNIFEDDISREVVINKIRQLLYNDPMCPTENKKGMRQYFDNGIFNLDDDEIYVDGGVFDGNSIIEFINTVNGKYHEIYGFELDDENYNVARKALSEFNNIKLFNQGLWKEIGSINYYKNRNKASNAIINNPIVDANLATGSLATLDTVFGGQTHLPTFIKLDIEGAEYECLEGGKNIIRINKPKLAICAYHKNDDYITLPRKILEINPEYKLYLRHFTTGWLDSIIFAK